MSEVDDHDDDIESELGRIEGPAAAAARLIDDQAAGLPPGIARIADPTDPDTDVLGAELQDGGIVGDFRMIVAERQIRRIPETQRQALARFIALMYGRAPKIQRAVARGVTAYTRGIDDAMASYGQSIDVGASLHLQGDLDRARWLGLREADGLSGPIAKTTWWIVKTAPDEEFVVGDSPVTTTLALGHDDKWRGLIAPDVYVILMPLSPQLALMAGRLLPVTVEANAVVHAINLLSWKWAEEVVMASSCPVLRQMHAAFRAAGWADSAPASVDAEATYWRGVGFVHRYLTEYLAPTTVSVQRLRAMALKHDAG